jgi:hypothetical protein
LENGFQIILGSEASVFQRQAALSAPSAANKKAEALSFGFL